jgi:hypothetical protein
MAPLQSVTLCFALQDNELVAVREVFRGQVASRLRPETRMTESRGTSRSRHNAPCKRRLRERGFTGGTGATD